MKGIGCCSVGTSKPGQTFWFLGWASGEEIYIPITQRVRQGTSTSSNIGDVLGHSQGVLEVIWEASSTGPLSRVARQIWGTWSASYEHRVHRKQDSPELVMANAEKYLKEGHIWALMGATSSAQCFLIKARSGSPGKLGWGWKVIDGCWCVSRSESTGMGILESLQNCM